MPTFNQEIFNNSLLMKRLNTSGGDKLVKSKESTKIEHSENKLTTVEKSQDEIGNMMTNSFGNSGNHPFYNHIIYQRDPGSFAPKMNKSADNAELINKQNISNNTELFKSLLTAGANGGVIFSDQNVNIDVKIKAIEKGCLGLMFTFISSNNKIEDIEFYINDDFPGLNIQISKIKYPQDESGHPQAMMKAYLKSTFINPPIVNFSARVGMMNINSSFAIPLVITKFFEPIDLSVENFTTMFYEFTNSNDEVYHKFDTVMVNPMENKGTIIDFLKKIGGLLNSLNFKVYPPNNLNEFHEIDAMTSLNYDSGNIPILIQIAFLPSYSSEFRFSIRAKVSDSERFKNLTENIYSVIKFYVNPY